MGKTLFIDRLIDSIREKDNPSVAGLDPRLNMIPSSIKEKAFKEYGVNLLGASRAVFDFNTRIIDAIYDIVPAVKPQLAFYEQFGADGIRAFSDTVSYAAKKGLIVICDGKRNDIGSTAEGYSSAYLGKTGLSDSISTQAFDCDALTVNPYLGSDGIKPFLEDCRLYGKGVFILVKTSNKSSGELQDLKTEDGKYIYEIVAESTAKWGRDLVGKYGYSSVGAVVGATYPEQASALRKIMKNSFILVPGYGAQGGAAEDAAVNFNPDGLGAIVNASRSLTFAYLSEHYQSTYGESKFAEAARAEAIRMRDDIKRAVKGRREN